MSLALIVVVAMMLVAVPNAGAQTSLGVTNIFGNPSSAAGTTGGLFSTTPRGVALNDASGDIYVVDSGNHRMQRFGSGGTFKSAWGFDVVSPGATGTGDLVSGSPTVSALAPTTGAFLVGQRITGTGIPAGTTIQAIPDGAHLTLSANATASGTGVSLTATSPGNADAIQSIIVKATSGQFKLTFGGDTTGDLAYNASASAVETALNALPSISTGGGSVTVTGGPGDASGSVPYGVQFTGGALAGTAQSALTTSNGTTPLAGGPSSATVTTINAGGADVGFEICTVKTLCKIGINTVTPAPGGELSTPQGVAINQTTGNLYVSNQGYRRMEEFTASGIFVRAWGGDVVRTGQPGDSPLSSAVEKLTVDANNGTFKLTFLGQSTADLTYDITASNLQTALQGLSSIGTGNVTVTDGPGGSGGATPYIITFAGALANNPEPLFTAANGATPLSGGGATATMQYNTPTSTGSNLFEICTAALDCQIGANGAVDFTTQAGYPAVAPSGAPNAGNVLVGDAGKRVQEFTSGGAFVRSFGFDVVQAGIDQAGTGFETCKAASFDVCKRGVGGSGSGQFNAGAAPPAPSRVAVDSTGAVYTVESLQSNFRVQKFTTVAGALQAALFDPVLDSSAPTVKLSGTDTASTPLDVAIGPADHVWVTKPCSSTRCPGAALATERRVYEFDSSGVGPALDVHAVDYGIASANGLALKSGGLVGAITAPTPNPSVYVLGAPVAPTATINATTAVTATTATFHGVVNPNGGDPALKTSYRFEYSTDGSNWSRVPAANALVGGDTTDHVVSEGVTGLEPNQHYQVRLVALKAGSPTFSTGDVGDFTTDPSPPSVTTLAPYWDSSTNELVARGNVNPNNTATIYHFEYGTEPCSSGSCVSTPDAAAGSDGALVYKTERIASLEPDTTYHVRLVADNGVGSPVTGTELSLSIPAFTTLCPNEHLKAENHSAALAECRAYEWVSNGDSWAAGVWAYVSQGRDGDGVRFHAQAFGRPSSAPAVLSPYTALRGDSGWEVRDALPPADLARGAGLSTLANYAMSADMRHYLWPLSTLGQQVRGEVQWAIRDIDGGSDAVLSPLEPLTWAGPTPQFSGYRVMEATDDLSSSVVKYSGSFGSGIALFEDEQPLMHLYSNLYQITGAGSDDPQLHLVNRASNPAPGVPGPVIGGTCGAGFGASSGNPENVLRSQNALSHDGSIVYFSATPDTNVTDCSAADAGKRLFKRVDNQLTVAVSECAKTSPSVCSGNGPDEYAGASSDGSVAFFTSARQLTDSDSDNTLDLYIYDADPPAGQPQLVQVSAGEVVAGDHPTAGSGAEVLQVLDVSNDGSRAYFTAKGRLTPEATQGVTNVFVFERDQDHPSGRIDFVATVNSGSQGSALGSDGHLFRVTSSASLLPGEDIDSSRDVYLYDDDAGQVICASCMGHGAFDVAGATSDEAATTIAFATKERLLPSVDTNDATDVYAWRRGALVMISVGTGDAGAHYLQNDIGVSADGRDVFFVTRAGLNSADTNNALDVYTARIGGGFAAPAQTPPCTEPAGCQGASTAIPALAALATSAPGTDGNATAKSRIVLRVGSLSRAKRSLASRSGVLPVAVTTSAAGKVAVVVRAKFGRRIVRIAKASRDVSSPGRIGLRIRLSDRPRRWLRSGKPLPVLVSIAQDGARIRTATFLLPGVKS